MEERHKVKKARKRKHIEDDEEEEGESSSQKVWFIKIAVKLHGHLRWRPELAL